MPDTTNPTQTLDTTAQETEPSITTTQDQPTDGTEDQGPGSSQTTSSASETGTISTSSFSENGQDTTGPAADAQPFSSPTLPEQTPGTTGEETEPSTPTDQQESQSSLTQPDGGSEATLDSSDSLEGERQPTESAPSSEASDEPTPTLPETTSQDQTSSAAAPTDTTGTTDPDPTPAQTDPAALAAPGEITGGADASAQGDVAQGPTDTPDSGAATDTGINTDTGIDTDTSIDTDTDTDTGINTDTGISPDQSSEAPVAKTPDHGSDGEGGDQEAESFGTVADSVGSEIAQSLQQDGPSGDDSAQDTSQQEDQGDDDSSKGGVPAEDAVVPPMFDGDAGEGPTHAGTDTPPMLISKPCDPVTGKPLDGSMQPVGVIVGGSGSLNKVSVPADSGDGGWQDAEADDGSSSSDACDDDNECCGLQDQLLQVRSAVEDLVSQVQDTAQQILQLLQ